MVLRERHFFNLSSINVMWFWIGSYGLVFPNMLPKLLLLGKFSSLTYATSVARPTKTQIEQLRTKIYQAAAFRFFQTQDAHALLVAKTHAFDPQHAMVYQNLCFWRRAYHDLPHIVPEIVS